MKGAAGTGGSSWNGMGLRGAVLPRRGDSMEKSAGRRSAGRGSEGRVRAKPADADCIRRAFASVLRGSRSAARIRKRIRRPADLIPFCSVADPAEGLVPMRPWPHVLSLLDWWDAHDRTVLVKSRQMGVSWAIALYALHMLAFRGEARVALSLNYKQEEAAQLLRRMRILWASLVTAKVPVPDVRWSEERAVFSNGSLAIALPVTGASGAGHSASLLVVDEAALIPGLEDVWPAVSQGLERGRIHMISTPRGDSNFFARIVAASREGCGPFAYRRLHYSEHPDKDPGTERGRAWLAARKAELSERDFAREHECEFVRSGASYFDDGTIRIARSTCRGPLAVAWGGRLKLWVPRAGVACGGQGPAWRCGGPDAESASGGTAPGWPEEAASGGAVPGGRKEEAATGGAIPERKEEAAGKAAHGPGGAAGSGGARVPEARMPDGDPGGCAIVRRAGSFVIGADAAEGLEDGDRSAAVVLDRRTGEQVAAYHARAGVTEYAEDLVRLARMFDDAWLAIEANNHGHAVCAWVYRHCGYRRVLRDSRSAEGALGAPAGRLGITTTAAGKTAMLAAVEAAIREGRLVIRDGHLADELSAFIRLPGGGCGAGPGSHDDRVIALMLAQEARESRQPRCG
ncbi:MAG: terminase family protein [Planctomycetota bacterium]|nr:terminase family protein [Planctomycetota bacterium]